MSTPKHTPGPWKISGNYVLDKENYLIASIAKATDRDSDSLEETKETKLLTGNNAALIAAAPELLDICNHILKNHLALGEQGDAEYIRILSDVIAKAKGEIK